MGPDASLTPELIQAQSFTSTFRGFDQGEVRSFLNRVATELRAWRERAEQLESAWHSAEERAARPPVLDEDTLMSAVGEETASILRSARAAATDMRTKAAEEAEKLLSDARTESEQLVTRAQAEASQLLSAAQTEAENLRADAGEESSKVRSDAQAEAERLLSEAHAEADRLRTAAEDAAVRTAASAEDAAARLMSGARTDAAEILEKSRLEAEATRAAAEKDRQLTIEGANSTRDRILEDLSRRRHIATVQIEQLRAGRERLIESYAVVRRTLEEASSELSRADAEARAAAHEVGRRMQEDPNLVSEDLAGTGPYPEVPTFLESGPHQEEPDQAEPDQAEPEKVEPEAEAADPTDTAIEAPEPEAPEAEAPEAEAAEPEPETAEPEPEPQPEPVEPEAVEEEIEEILAVEVEPEPEAPEAPEALEEEPSGSAVDELFARIRATRAGDRAPAEQPAAAPAAAPAVAAEAEPATDNTETAAETAPGTDAEDAEEEDGEPRLSDADESLLQRRESAVVDLETTLTRRLKRSLQDEQNDLLDRLRNLRGDPTADRLLPPVEEQTDRYVEAARTLLARAAEAGADFALAALGAEAPEEGPDLDVEDLAAEMGTGIVEPLRRRLEQAITRSAGDDQAVLIEALGAAYREWKTSRIERLAGDGLSAAFSRGTWRSVPEGTVLRWIVEDTDGPCPDCDDDALAGELPKGEAFPTGQHHPPAHSGCRCLLVPGPPAG